MLLADGKNITLSNNAMRWAGKCLKEGDQIWVRQQNKEWVLGQIPEANSALVSLNSDNGAIEALVGGFSFEQSKFNRATQSLVQVGSSIKPFILRCCLGERINFIKCFIGFGNCYSKTRARTLDT